MHDSMVKTEGNRIELDMRSSDRSHRYVARCIWQILFRLYREADCSLGNLDNLLCDLYGLELYLERRTPILYWSAYKEGSTDLQEDLWQTGFNEAVVVKINLWEDVNTIVFEVIQGE